MSLHVAVAGWLCGRTPCGAARRLESILRAAAPQLRAGERVTVLVGDRDAALPAIPGIDRLAVPIPASPTWRRVLQENLLLPRLLADVGASVLDLGTLPVPPRLPCPVALTVHDLRDETEFRRRPKLIAHHVLRASLRRATHVIVPSDFTARCLEQSFADCLPGLTVVPGGVDAGFFRRSLRELDWPFFLHVGHLEPRKNLHMLLRAFARFRERPGASTGRRPALLLVGSDHGEGASLRREAEELGLGGAVHFAPHVDDEALRDFYGDADAVLVPSLYEGFGMPVLEGLAMGKPVLVSDRGALPEVGGDAARVVRADDTVAWAEAMSSVCTERPSVDVEHQRRNRARRFSWPLAAAHVLDVWRRCASD